MIERAWEKKIEPLTVRISTAVRITGLSRSRIYELIQSGDLDTVKVGRATPAKVGSHVRARLTPRHVVVRRTRAKVSVVVTAADRSAVSGTVRISGRGIGPVTVVLRKGRATVRLAPFTRSGWTTLRIAYAGSTHLRRSETTLVVRVVGRR